MFLEVKDSLPRLWKSFLKSLLWGASLLQWVATATALSCHRGRGGGVRQSWFTHHLKNPDTRANHMTENNNDPNAPRGEINIRQHSKSHKGLNTHCRAGVTAIMGTALVIHRRIPLCCRDCKERTTDVDSLQLWVAVQMGLILVKRDYISHRFWRKMKC